ncbi:MULTISPECIES: hypothetical protein [unclassified Sphingomonas]|uniref:hypothetical protein n=1 Tax=unclassified Sphingomonas TaxID=196159 RepID=UPI001D114D58|nr:MULTISPECIES: hypothetical protein [unclassified Sphingomonas]MCC2979594.1 hypothetical protein [Sphingomonas sp. IC4-52]MCD2315176.1 hypothetical protein [Sphingomonas sp. IC-11]
MTRATKATGRAAGLYAAMMSGAALLSLAGSAQLSAQSGQLAGQRLSTVTQVSLAGAIADARAAIARSPGSRYTIALPAGVHDLSGGDARAASIDLSRIDACPGMLTITGAGKDRTTIITDDDLVGIMGRRTSCVTVADLTMTRRKIETTQGHVVALTPNSVTIDIPQGFPAPTSLLSNVQEEYADGREVNRKWLRRFNETPQGPQIDVEQPQVNWLSAVRAPGGKGRWHFNLREGRNMPRLRPGDLIGVKSKFGRDAYRFTDGAHITFRGVRWLMETRGIFHRVDYVTIEDCSISPPPPINGIRFALASSSGGPQIGHPMQPSQTRGHLVTGNDFRGTGDDALMFAHASGLVENNRLADSFALGIRIYESPGLRIGRNVTERAPIVRIADDVLENNNRPERRRLRPAA